MKCLLNTLSSGKDLRSLQILSFGQVMSFVPIKICLKILLKDKKVSYNAAVIVIVPKVGKYTKFWKPIKIVKSFEVEPVWPKNGFDENAATISTIGGKLELLDCNDQMLTKAWNFKSEFLKKLAKKFLCTKLQILKQMTKYVQLLFFDEVGHTARRSNWYPTLLK